MKKIILLALAVQLSLVPHAIAQTVAQSPTTQEDCEAQDGKKWDAETKTCVDA